MNDDAKLKSSYGEGTEAQPGPSEKKPVKKSDEQPQTDQRADAPMNGANRVAGQPLQGGAQDGTGDLGKMRLMGPDKAFRIVRERPARAFESLHRHPAPRAHIALVLLTAKGDYVVLHPDRNFPTWNPMWRRIRTVYEVDLGQHQSSFVAEIPSRGDKFPFHAAVDVQWEVDNPCLIVRKRLNITTAVAEVLRPEILRRMREIARKFEVDESEAAERKINENAGLYLGADLGLRTVMYVRLTLEPSTVTYLRELRKLERKVELEDLTQTLRKKTEENEHELLERRLPFYRELISEGDVERFALQIARNEGDLGVVIEAFHKARDANRRNVVEFFTRLMESGLIERHEMNDRIRETLDWLNESVTRMIGKEDGHLTDNNRRRRHLAPLPDLPTAPGEVSPENDSDNHKQDETRNGADYTREPS